MSGQVGDTSATIWVNGIQGTNCHDGTWHADGVPIYGHGTATFNASASSGGCTSTVSLEVEMPPKIVTTGYALTESNVVQFLTNKFVSRDINVSYHASLSPDLTNGWRYHFAGTAGNYYNVIGTNDNITGTWSETATNAIETFFDPGGTHHVYPYDFATHTNLTTIPHMDSPVTHYYAKGQRYEFEFSPNDPLRHERLTISLDAETMETLYTGGKSPVRRQTLFSLDCQTAESYEPAPLGGFYWVYLPWQNVRTNVLDKSRAQMGSLGQVASDGKVWKNLPANSSGIDVTPHLRGAKSFNARAAASRYVLHITANTIDTLNTAPPFCVGQKVTFGVTGFPDGIDPATITYTWDFREGNYVNAFTNPIPGVSSVNYFKNTNQVNSAAPFAWWVSGGDVNPENYAIHVDCNFILTNGLPAVGTGDGGINMYKPNIDWNGTIISPIQVRSDYVGNSLFPGQSAWVYLGGYSTNSTNAYGIIFKMRNINTHGFTDGKIFPLQVVAPSKLVNCQTNGESRHQTNDFGLDNNLGFDNSLVAFYDSPGSACKYGDQKISLSFFYQAFLMFNPDKTGGSESIDVPLRLIAWQWQATATNGTSNDWGLSITPSSSITSDNQDAAGNFPMWRTNLQVSWPSGYGRYTNNDCSL